MSSTKKFLAGILLANAVPHGLSAVQGRRFPTPFANPPGVGLSGPMANALWSGLNAAGGVALLGRSPQGFRERISLGAGAIAMSFFLAHYFGKARDN
ncbi:hypothetical protein N2K95_09915 [Arthrobacter zhaoxinii]|uniref:Uncharacterized protein n=1 Tax=Arthrobacter zhaoxinii TaxID=2964616 RepID=A0ABY5YLN8_9MICC|nr:hypothetical protein [Arthrobacter zhaoxinii]UWX96007.1 hypothetical protein N2K95_09915 [Arthrobacter zhaoxinii]